MNADRDARSKGDQPPTHRKLRPDNPKLPLKQPTFDKDTLVDAVADLLYIATAYDVNEGDVGTYQMAYLESFVEGMTKHRRNAPLGRTGRDVIKPSDINDLKLHHAVAGVLQRFGQAKIDQRSAEAEIGVYLTGPGGAMLADAETISEAWESMVAESSSKKDTATSGGHEQAASRFLHAVNVAIGPEKVINDPWGYSRTKRALGLQRTNHETLLTNAYQKVSAEKLVLRGIGKGLTHDQILDYVRSALELI